MAKPIKETPILKGKDAKDFVAKVAEATTKKADTKEKNRIQENYKKFKSLVTY